MHSLPILVSQTASKLSSQFGLNILDFQTHNKLISDIATVLLDLGFDCQVVYRKINLQNIGAHPLSTPQSSAIRAIKSNDELFDLHQNDNWNAFLAQAKLKLPQYHVQFSSPERPDHSGYANALDPQSIKQALQEEMCKLDKEEILNSLPINEIAPPPHNSARKI